MVGDGYHNNPSSFSQWLIRLLTTLDEGHPDYDEAKDLLEILGKINHHFLKMFMWKVVMKTNKKKVEEVS